MDIVGESIPRTLDWKEKTYISMVQVELFEQGGCNIDIGTSLSTNTTRVGGQLTKVLNPSCRIVNCEVDKCRIGRVEGSSRTAQ